MGAPPSSGLEVIGFETEKFECRSAEQPLPGLFRQLRQRFDELARLLFAKRKWIIAPQRNPLRPQQLDKVTQRVGIVDERIDVEPGEVAARAGRIVDGTEIGPDAVGMLDPA